MFETIKRKKGFEGSKDINQYAVFNDLEDVVDKFSGEFQSKREEVRQYKEEGAQLLYEEGEYEIIEITQPEAACYYSKNTKWCVSDYDTAIDYLRNSPLYLILKNNNHFALMQIEDEDEVQLMDPRDRPMSLRNLPIELKKLILLVGRRRWVDLREVLKIPKNTEGIPSGDMRSRRWNYYIKNILPNNLTLIKARRYPGRRRFKEEYIIEEEGLIDEISTYVDDPEYHTPVLNSIVKSKLLNWAKQVFDPKNKVREDDKSTLKYNNNLFLVRSEKIRILARNEKYSCTRH